MIETTSNELFAVIGQLYLENLMLKRQVRQLQARQQTEQPVVVEDIKNERPAHDNKAEPAQIEEV